MEWLLIYSLFTGTNVTVVQVPVASEKACITLAESAIGNVDSWRKFNVIQGGLSCINQKTGEDKLEKCSSFKIKGKWEFHCPKSK